MSSKIADINTPLADSLRAAFFQFYLSHAHKEVPNASLVPNVDSTLLFTNSGMFPLVSYLAGEKHPLGTRLVNFQRSLRTGEKDLAEIGDWKHTTMFEMMGNWSLGDYFKGEQIPQVMELYVEKFGLDPKRMYVSVFAGDSDAPRDDEAITLWKEAFKRYGVDADLAPVFFETQDGREIAYEIAADGSKMYRTDWNMDSFPNQRIFMYGKKENWWQRGNTAGELGGPDSEMFYNTGAPHDEATWGVGHPNSDSPTYLEIGNSVFMQYRLDENLKWQELPQKNVDFGGGFVRVLLSREGVSDVYETEVFVPVIKKIEEISGKNYKQDGEEYDLTKYFRIIADHIFGSTFVIADGVMPGNKEQGYILRRFIRRAIRMGKRLGIEKDFLAELSEVIIGIYQRHYEHLAPAVAEIATALQTEEAKFRRTLANGVKELQKLAESQKGGSLTGKELFHVYETYGFPLELSFEELGVAEGDQARLTEEFKSVENLHKEASRAGAAQKFTGGLADKSTETTRLHTAHHLLLRALQIVLGDSVHQKGSNITAERLRIDFSSTEKLTDDQKSEVEKIVNEQMQSGLNVVRVELAKDAAMNLGAEMEFGQKYGETVSVYMVGKDLPADLTEQLKAKSADEVAAELAKYEIFSKEFCGGPHVSNTKELLESGDFKISKEESSGAGVRRIKAVLRKA